MSGADRVAATDAPADGAGGSLPPSLGRLMAGKAVANTALRWVPPFLPTLERAFGASTTQLTTILGAAEMSGLSTIAAGRHLDRGRERLIMTIGLVCIVVASLVALVGFTFTFAVGAVLVVIGVAGATVAGHAFISHRVAYDLRARSIGIFETSWALALLVGAPVFAVLIELFGWRGPYVALALSAAAIGTVIWRSPTLAAPPPGPPRAAEVEVDTDDSMRRTIGAFTPAAWCIVAGSSFVAMAGLSVFAVSGSWLDDAFGVSTGGLGAVAMGFGAVELLSSSGSAAFADRIGKLRGTVGGIALLLVGALVMTVADSTLWIGVIGILALLCGFEFAIVTSFSLVSEAVPAARGTTIAVSSALSTVARGTGTMAGGWLYGIHGIEGTLALSAVAATLSAAAFLAGRRAVS